MSAPLRIQRKRTAGWRVPPNTVSVTRPGKWGNRWRVGDVAQRFTVEKVCETFMISTAAQAVECFREDIANHLANPKAAGVMRAALDELRGKNLACFCRLCSKHENGKPYIIRCPDCAPCHADPLGC